MKPHPAKRLAAWRCVIGKRDSRGAWVEDSFPRMLSTADPSICESHVSLLPRSGQSRTIWIFGSEGRPGFLNQLQFFLSAASLKPH
jgi:hypothetical protein